MLYEVLLCDVFTAAGRKPALLCHSVSDEDIIYPEEKQRVS